MKKPILIEIDGPEGASKSTLIGALQGKASPIVEFKSATSNWKFCRLPGTSKLGEYLRPVVKEFKMLPQTSLGIALAGMSDAYQDMINSKCNIVVDRGLTSVLMYQFNLDGAYKANPILAETIYDTLRRQVEDAFDYYRVIVWAHPSIIVDRLSKRGIDKKDKYDSLSEAQFAEMVDTYIKLAKDEVHFSEEKTFLLNTDKLTVEEEVKSFEDIFNHIKGMHEKDI